MHLDNMLIFMLYIVESCYCTFVGDMIMRCTRSSPQAVYSLCIRTYNCWRGTTGWKKIIKMLRNSDPIFLPLSFFLSSVMHVRNCSSFWNFPPLHVLLLWCEWRIVVCFVVFHLLLHVNVINRQFDCNQWIEGLMQFNEVQSAFAFGRF